MAKTKLEVELEKKKVDWKRVETLLESYSAFNKYWNKYKEPKFRKMLIKYLNYFFLDLDEKIIDELKSKKYKKDIQKYYNNINDWYSASEAAKQIELINFHKIDVSVEFIKQLYFEIKKPNIFIYMKDKTLSKLKEIILSKNLINIGNLHIIKDDLTKEKLISLSSSQKIFKDYYCRNKERNEIYPEFIELFKNKLSLSDIFNTIDNEISFYIEVIDIYGFNNFLNELLKTKKKISFKNSTIVLKDDEKIKLNKEQTKTLLKHQDYKILSEVFFLFPSDETFVYDLCNSKEPSIFSDKVNKIILNGDFDALKKDNYNFIDFKNINLTTETAKILYDKNKLRFKYYKKFGKKDEVEKIIKEKETEILKLLKDKESPNKILDIIKDYDISLDFIVENFTHKDSNNSTFKKTMIAHMLLDDMRYGDRYGDKHGFGFFC